jgi:predicted deacetylase
MTFITPLCLTDVSSEKLEQLQELKEQVDVLAAVREKVSLIILNSENKSFYWTIQSKNLVHS